MPEPYHDVGKRQTKAYTERGMGERVSTRRVQEVRTQLRAVGASSYQLAKQEIVELAKLLGHSENIQAFMYGFYDAGYGMLVATNRRILFIDKRFYNLKVEDIPYAVVNSVEYHLGFFFGTAKLYTRAQNFYFWWVKKRDLLNFCEYVDGKMLEAQRRAPRPDA